MSEAAFNTHARCAGTADVHAAVYKLRMAMKEADSYFDKNSANYVADEDKRAEKAMPFWEASKRLALELAALKPSSPQAMVLRAQAVRDLYTEASPPEALADAVISDLADLPVLDQKEPLFPSPFTPAQQEELIQFAKTANCIAENLSVTALQWVPQIFNHLPETETDIAEEAAEAIGHISQFLKDLTAERILLRKAGVYTVV